MNVVFITKKFCINKDKPELQCNGKCHLAKQLQIAEQQNNKNKEIGANFLQLINPVYFFNEQVTNLHFNLNETTSPEFIQQMCNLHKGYYDIPKVPPQIL